MTLQEFHTRLLEACPKCSYQLYLSGTVFWTPAHTMKLTLFQDVPAFPSHRELSRYRQEADYTLYLQRDFFAPVGKEVRYEATNLEALLLNATVGSVAEAWSSNGAGEVQ